jgi:hypothetical protein
MSTTKNAYNALEYLLVILHQIMKNARYNRQDESNICCSFRTEILLSMAVLLDMKL